MPSISGGAFGGMIPAGMPTQQQQQQVAASSSAVASASSRSASFPDLRRAAGVAVVNPRWLCMGNGYHVLAPQDDDHEHGLREARHEASEALKWEQRRALQAEHRGGRLLEHQHKSGLLNQREAALKLYDINGKVIQAGKRALPIPAQSNSTHWTCQVSGQAAEYNIVNNTPMHPHLMQHRREEMSRSRSFTTLGAGDCTPSRNIACFEMRKFVPVRQRSIPGSTERHYTLAS
eukprot:TRINITY_DN27022_c0_g1_i1.p1 TRINITY_DN27022_c0_g1~~TRINITY_DN27022_c0_g1_i1.p1  ORF type:complete len:259 (-),score=33.98 TRINITY_DN27022_c0_g1_i1:53-751(-)